MTDIFSSDIPKGTFTSESWPHGFPLYSWWEHYYSAITPVDLPGFSVVRSFRSRQLSYLNQQPRYHPMWQVPWFQVTKWVCPAIFSARNFPLAQLTTWFGYDTDTSWYSVTLSVFWCHWISSVERWPLASLGMLRHFSEELFPREEPRVRFTIHCQCTRKAYNYVW